jgi:hypothetical protein
MSGEPNTGKFSAVGGVLLPVFGGVEGVAMTVFAHPLGFAKTVGFGVRGGESGSCNVCIGVVVFLWNSDVHRAEDALWVDMFWTDGQCASEP